jgi:hypothetical protein
MRRELSPAEDSLKNTPPLERSRGLRTSQNRVDPG